MICRHLCEQQGLGYHRVEVPPDVDDYETGLCEECDALLHLEEGWTDRLFEFADWKLYCRHCFERALANHTLIGIGQLAPDEESDEETDA